MLQAHVHEFVKWTQSLVDMAFRFVFAFYSRAIRERGGVHKGNKPADNLGSRNGLIRQLVLACMRVLFSLANKVKLPRITFPIDNLYLRVCACCSHEQKK